MRRPRVILLNHTAADHPGCRLTCEVITGIIRRHADLVATYPTPRPTANNRQSIDYTGIDVLLINGEGTMHHHHPDKPRHSAAELHRQAVTAKAAGLRVAMVNTLLHDFNEDLSIYDYISVRESLSFAEAVSRGVERVELATDACFHHLDEQPRPLLPQGVLVIDSVIREVSENLEEFARQRSHEFLKFRKLTPKAALNRVRNAQLVITGRYHGAVFALMTRTPVVCLSSNSHKIEGLLRDFGLERCLVGDTSQIPDSVPTSDRDLVPLARRIDASIQRAIFGDGPRPAPTLAAPNAWQRGVAKFSLSLRRAVTPRPRRHQLHMPQRFIEPIRNHAGYRKINWNGRTAGALQPLAPLRGNDRRDMFIVASGPSVEHADLRFLRRHACIAVNGGIVKFQQMNLAPDYYVAVDKDFAQHRFELMRYALTRGAHCFLPSHLLSHLCHWDAASLGGASLYPLDPVNRRYGEDSCSREQLRAGLTGDSDLLIHPDSTFDPHDIGFSRNLERGSFHSKTVVHAALQVAYFLGSTRVFILGMDLGGPTGQATRFYEKTSDTRPSHLNEFFKSHIIPGFEIVRDLGKRERFEVYNVSPASRLPDSIFPKISLGDARRMTEGDSPANARKSAKSDSDDTAAGIAVAASEPQREATAKR